MASLAVVLLAAASSSSCKKAPPRESQVLLVVRTDAPLPRTADDSAPALFDRLAVAMFPPGGTEPCANCTQEFALDDSLVASGNASFALVVPHDVTGHRTAITLYRGRGLLPRASSSIAHVYDVPALREGELMLAHVDLRVAEVAQPVGSLAEPRALPMGAGETLARWNEALVKPCAGEPGSGEACVEGGAFWMGDPTADIAGLDDEGGRFEHLVVVDPFFIDRAEVTVAELRAANVALRDELGRTYDPPDTMGEDTRCTYRDAPGATDMLPVTCISQPVARAYCEHVGKRLPTDAEYERVASGSRATPFVWGVDPASCEDAVFGRGPTARCAGEAGPAVAATGKRDRITLHGALVVDLGGNVAEWVADVWNRDAEPCVSAPIAINPRCETPSTIDGPARTVRGNSWRSTTMQPVAVRYRTFATGAREGASDEIGFRCVRSATH